MTPRDDRDERSGRAIRAAELRARDRAQRQAVALLLTKRETGVLLGVSETQIRLWRREGLLHPVPLPTAGIKHRAIRYARSEIEALAAKWCAQAMGETA